MSDMNKEQLMCGLSDSQVNESKAKYGTNELAKKETESLWSMFIGAFDDIWIKVLCAALALKVILAILGIFVPALSGGNDVVEIISIVIAIALATGFSTLSEYRNTSRSEALQEEYSKTYAKVMRNGKLVNILTSEIVKGDTILVQAGDKVPADGLIFEGKIKVSQAALNGESRDENKAAVSDMADAESTDYSSVGKVFMGSVVTSGEGYMVATVIGDNSELGKINKALTDTDEEEERKDTSSLKLEGVAAGIGKLGVSAAAIAGILHVVLTLVRADEAITVVSVLLVIAEAVMLMASIVIMAVPEGLPMSVTLSLALSMRKMLKSNNLVRKMHACETMGATTVICTDKTGTLTQNQMTVYKTNFYGLKDQQLADNENSRLIKEGIAVNTTAFLDFSDPDKVKTLGNPTEAALLLWLNGQQANYQELRENATVIDQLTFSTERKYMATLVDSPVMGKKILYVKGAPEIIFAQCKNALIDGELQPIANYKTTVENQLLEYQNQAMRTLGFAYQVIEDNESHFKDGRLYNTELTFLGIVAISDPIRPDVPDAVKRCFDAGIQVKMVTGDTPGTAKEIGRQIGLWTEKDTDRNVITGVEFAQLTDKEALDRVLDLKIMSRARPMDKQRLVQLLQQKQAIVAVTGDGTNDAPALNHAHVGLSMGSGTSVAKEASDITLLDDSFSSITSAVMWGRSVYQNIQRFILFQLTINVAALIIVLLGSLFGSELPITVTQMLWVNLIMDTFAAGALASLPPSPEVMKRKPRNSNAFIIVPQMQRLILATGITFVVILLGLLYVLSNYAGGIEAGTPEGLRNLTIFFTVFVMLQFWNMFNAKTFGTNDSAFKNIFKSEGFLTVGMAIIVGQILVVNFGGSVFRTIPLTWSEWIWITLATSLVLWVGEIFRAFKRMKNRK